MGPVMQLRGIQSKAIW